MKANGCEECGHRQHFARGLCHKCWMQHTKAGTLPPTLNHRKAERRCDSNGYIIIINEAGLAVSEHRHVMQKKLGRPLVRGEAVHHMNGDRADNRPENLELWYRPQPAGQRVADLIEYVRTYHLEAVLAA